MFHVKNLKSTRAFEELCSQKILNDKTSNIDHLKVLNIILYVFIHQENRKKALFKTIKFVSRIQLNKLIEYDDHIIYRVFLKKNYKIIRVMNLKIYEDSIFKTEIDLLKYDVIMIDVQREKEDKCRNIVQNTASVNKQRAWQIKKRINSSVYYWAHESFEEELNDYY